MRKNQKYTQEDMYAAIEHCDKEGISYSQYCQQQNIHYASFKYWVKKYSRQQPNSALTNKASFLPVHIQADAISIDRFTITYPNGTRIDCPTTTSIEYISAIIKVL